MKVYIITKCCSGSEYTSDETDILGVFADEAKAKKEFQNAVDAEIRDCEDEEIETNTYDCGSHYFELTNFDADYHTIIQLHEEEVK